MTNSPSSPSDPVANGPKCVEIEGVDPVFVPHMIIGAMAVRYARAAALPMDEAYDAARATWEADEMWPDDPRTFESALERVDEDLQHWEDE